MRTMLARSGLIGKIAIHSEMNEEDIRAEVCSCFSRAFGNNKSFPFKFLQSAGIRAKAHIVPATSDRYEWKPKQVATMSGSWGIYIWAQKPFAVKEEVVSCKIVI